jgi:hypothetical protein
LSEPARATVERAQAMPAEDLWMRIAEELRLLEWMARDLQDRIAPHLAQLPRELETGVSVQSLDLICQSLDDLARLMGETASTHRMSTDVDAAVFDTLRLADMANRLRNGNAPPRSRNPGDVSLF